ncbi:MAG: peptide ABC transporter substrate-binding protein [Syntrophobacteraceae bacterium]
MEPQISEADWKVFRRVRVSALERFCDRVLSEVSRLAAETGQSSHQRYLTVFKLLQKQDEQLADTFDSPRRSTAFLQLMRMRSQDLLTEEEFALFSSEIRTKVEWFLNPVD